MRIAENMKEELIKTGKLEEKLFQIESCKSNSKYRDIYSGRYGCEGFNIIVCETGIVIISENYLNDLVSAVNEVSDNKPCARYIRSDGNIAVEFEKYSKLRYRALKRNQKDNKIRNLQELNLS
jgi:hypothetical protein